MGRTFFAFGLYGSITTVQVYVPGFSPLAVIVAGSVFAVGELPMLLFPASVQVIWEFVVPAGATSPVAVTTRSVRGVSVAANAASFPSPQVEFVLTVTLCDVVSSIAYPVGAAVSLTGPRPS